MKLEPYHLGIVVALLMLALTATGTVSFDVGIAVVQAMLGVAPIIGIIENWRWKIGWSRNTVMTVSMGLLVIGFMMFLAGFVLTAASAWFSSAMYGILAVQTFNYGSNA